MCFCNGTSLREREREEGEREREREEGERESGRGERGRRERLRRGWDSWGGGGGLLFRPTTVYTLKISTLPLCHDSESGESDVCIGTVSYYKVLERFHPAEKRETTSGRQAHIDRLPWEI